MTCCSETNNIWLTEKFTINHQIIFLIRIFLKVCSIQLAFRNLFWVFWFELQKCSKKNSLLPVGLFFTDSALFYLFSVLQILSLLFIFKNFMAINKNSSPSWKSLFQVDVNYFNRDTKLPNQLMMSYVWREFSSVRRKMMKEDPGVSNAQAWWCPHPPPRKFKGTQASKLGDAPMHPVLHQQSSVRPSPRYIFITSSVMCYAWSVTLFTF